MEIVIDNFEKSFTDFFFKGFKASHIVIGKKKKEFFVDIESQNEVPECPYCHGHETVVHEYREKSIEDAFILNFKLYLYISYRSFKCKHCDIYATEQGEFIAEKVRKTKRFTEMILKDLEESESIRDTANRLGVSWDICKRIYQHSLQKKPVA